MTIDIWQIKDIEKCDYAFRTFKPALFNPKDYHRVYQFNKDGECENEKDYTKVLDSVFVKFNSGRIPRDYKGHSLSVSDIIGVNDKFYYCDYVGWKDITDILTSENFY